MRSSAFFLSFLLVLLALAPSPAFAAASGAPANPSPAQASEPGERVIDLVRDCGAKFDGATDDTAAIQRCFDSYNSMAVIHCPEGRRAVISSTLVANSWQWVTFYSRSATNGGAGCALKYRGPSGNGLSPEDAKSPNPGIVFHCEKCYHSVIDGIMFEMSDQSAPGATRETGADIAIWFDNAHGKRGLSSADLLENSTICLGSARNTPFTNIVYVNDSSGNNNEFHTFRNNHLGSCGRGRYGRAFYVGHPNAKSITFDHNSISGADVAHYIEYGSFIAMNERSGNVNIWWQVNGLAEPSRIYADNVEEIRQAIVGSNGGPAGSICNLLDEGSRYNDIDHEGATPAYPFISVQSQCVLTIADMGTAFAGRSKHLNTQWIASKGVSFLYAREWRNDGYGGTFSLFNVPGVGVDPGLTSFAYVNEEAYGHQTTWTNKAGQGPSSGLLQGATMNGTLRPIVGVTRWDAPNGISSACHTNDTICFEQGFTEIAELPVVSAASCNVSGATGTHYQIVLFARDAKGNRALGSNSNFMCNAASTLDANNFIALTWNPVPGATSYDVTRFDGGFRLIGTTSATNFSIKTPSTTWKPYTPPAFNETATRTNRLPFNDNWYDGGELAGYSDNGRSREWSISNANGAASFKGFSANNTGGVYKDGVLQHSAKTNWTKITLTNGSATWRFANAFSFSSAADYGCRCSDESAPRACRAVPVSGTNVTLEGAGNDRLFVACEGN
jgi:hypothetical protein